MLMPTSLGTKVLPPRLSRQRGGSGCSETRLCLPRGWKWRVCWGRFFGTFSDQSGLSVSQQFSPGPVWAGPGGGGCFPLSCLCDRRFSLLLIPLSFWSTAKASHAKWQFIHRRRTAHLWLNLVHIGQIKDIKHLSMKYEAKRTYQFKWTAKDHHHKSSLAFAFLLCNVGFCNIILQNKLKSQEKDLFSVETFHK